LREKIKKNFYSMKWETEVIHQKPVFLLCCHVWILAENLKKNLLTILSDEIDPLLFFDAFKMVCFFLQKNCCIKRCHLLLL
jgi:iron only hydrogenase large subunit-like protein